jgi:hypothetical protein
MATLGEQLKAARETKGVSKTEAGSATRILTKVIASMEANDFSQMAAPTYAKGFIRLYAEYLDLDPEPLVAEYMQNHAVAPSRLIDESSQLQQNTQITRGLPGLPAGSAAKLNPLPLLAPLGKMFSGTFKNLPLGPLKDIRVVAGIIAALLVLGALISTISTCVRKNTPEQPEQQSAAPARMLLEEPLPDLYYTEPGKIESTR